MAGKEPIKFVLGVDLDWVCADFAAGLRPIAAEWIGVTPDTLTLEPSVDFPEWGIKEAGGFDDLYRYAVTRRDLFRNVPPVPEAALTLRRLWTSKRLRIRIITYRLYFEYFHHVAVGQTIEWLDRYDFPYWDLCFMKDKAAVGADLYIDDSVPQVEALRKAGKHAILFVTSQNRASDIGGPRAKNWQEVEQLVIEAVDKWEKAQPATGPESLAGQ